MFWDKEWETLSRAELEQWQLRRLRSTVQHVARHVPFYQQKCAERGLGARAILSLKDIRRLPFTTREDLRATYPFGLLAVDRADVIRLHTSSGTTGKPKAMFFSKKDVAGAADLIARCLVMTGVGRGDVLQNMMTYGLFTGALVMHYGAEKVGLMVIPAGPGNSERQCLLMQDFRTTVFHTTPSYALYLAQFLKERGIDPRRDLSLRKAYIGAEPYSDETRRKIESALGVKVYNSYGLSEMNGPGVAFECEHQQGMHLWEDHFLIEIVDPATGNPVPDGEEGEMVLTTLRREAMPILRYRTRDITSVIRTPCPCGRTHRRIRRITGRADDMLIVRGVNLYPQQIERVLMSLPAVGHSYQIHLEGLDELIVKVELADASFDGRVEHLVNLQREIVERLRADLLVKPRVELLPPGSLPVSEGKAKRVFDKRIL
ncbi:MAG TPA: phenylacetate--CoA ligase [Candidatus Paceibacterota bacterium]|nr:phenylacetate--CoA ligase [Verrucomicrobiota bacterium]HOX00863.1 phenylacetate--CoA ligase [Verrucomicrobiota bacterium]HRZ43612.1 phenylacetate--CoA ligase [Candidatus Paceibacterota bacterium]HRZ94093.1 phenylacetate--CoA ligase [Candidatus Paceibacterota bacterium]